MDDHIVGVRSECTKILEIAAEDRSPPRSPPDHEHACVHVWRRAEGGPRHLGPRRQLEGAAPATLTGRTRPRPPPRRLLLQDQVGRDQAAAGLEQAAQQGRGHAERRVGDHVVRPPGQAEVPGVGLDHHDGVPEPLAKELRPPGMGLDGDDPRTGIDQWSRDRTVAGTDVHDPRTGADPCITDEPLRPPGIELVPAPPPLCRGHGDGPSRRTPCTKVRSPATSTQLRLPTVWSAPSAPDVAPHGSASGSRSVRRSGGRPAAPRDGGPPRPDRLDVGGGRDGEAGDRGAWKHAARRWRSPSRR